MAEGGMAIRVAPAEEDRSVGDGNRPVTPGASHVETSDAGRIQALDILRGFALVGILYANIPGLAHLAIPASGSMDDRLFQLENYAFEQRFFPIFAFLFGVGFSIFLRNAGRKGLPARRLFFRRLVVLVGFGIAHQFLQPGEALLLYGIFGLAIIPFAFSSVRVLLAAGGALLLVALPTTELLVIPAMFLFGAAAGRAGYFEDLARYRKLTRGVLISGVLLSPILVYLQYRSLGWDAPWVNYSANVQTLAGLVIAAGLVGAVSLALQRRAGARLLAPLAPFGRMALTNYIAQTLLVLGVIALLGMRDVMTYRQAFGLWVVICAVQIPLSGLWLGRFRYGPLEWVWRWLTYGRRPSFVR